jgi:hypothetical protein
MAPNLIITIAEQLSSVTGGEPNSGFFDTVSFSDVIVALLAASVALALNILYDLYKSKAALKAKRNVLKADLNNQIKVLERMEKDFATLITRFKNNQFEPYVMDAYEDLHLDIYLAMEKDVLYAIYKEKVVALVEVYKIIGFLIDNTPGALFERYINFRDEHNKAKGYDKAHLTCKTQQENISVTIKNSELNVISIRNALRKISSL